VEKRGHGEDLHRRCVVISSVCCALCFPVDGLIATEDVFTRPSESSDAITYTSSAMTHLADLTAASSSSSSTSAASASACAVHTACVDWYHYSADQIRAFEADVIIACDTTYIPEILVPFARTVSACLKANPRAIVYLAQAERHPSTFLLYLDALRVRYTRTTATRLGSSLVTHMSAMLTLPSCSCWSAGVCLGRRFDPEGVADE
jgi:hypothetical protein